MNQSLLIYEVTKNIYGYSDVAGCANKKKYWD